MKDSRQWIMRLVSLALILVILGAYQSVALGWEATAQENQTAVEDAEEHNAEVLKEEARRAAAAAAAQDSAQEGSVQEETVEEDLGPYIDGSYTGTGTGFGGDVTVTVTISGGYIEEITVDSASGEDSAYFAIAKEILDNIIEAQSADVDTISGATFSSTGLRDAVSAALSQAEGT